MRIADNRFKDTGSDDQAGWESNKNGNADLSNKNKTVYNFHPNNLSQKIGYTLRIM